MNINHWIKVHQPFDQKCLLYAFNTQLLFCFYSKLVVYLFCIVRLDIIMDDQNYERKISEYKIYQERYMTNILIDIRIKINILIIRTLIDAHADEINRI